MFLILSFLIILTPHPSLFQSPESNQDNTSNDNANLTTTMTSNDSKDSNDTTNHRMAKSSNKSTASAAAKKSAKKSSNKRTTGMEAIDLNTPPKEEATRHRHSLALLH